jgi:hypothetical protein
MTLCTQGMHYIRGWNLVYEMLIKRALASVALCPLRVITFCETLSAWAQDYPYGLTEDTNNIIYWSHSCQHCTGVVM